MTLTKAVKELLEELERPDLTEEEKKALDKYKMWLLSIKTTVTNNKEPLEHLKEFIPIKERRQISQALDTVKCGYAGGEDGCHICKFRGRDKWSNPPCMGMDEAVHILDEFIGNTIYIDEEDKIPNVDNKQVNLCSLFGYAYCDGRCSICPSNMNILSTTTGDIK